MAKDANINIKLFIAMRRASNRVHDLGRGEQPSSVPVVVEREGEENRSTADRVHNRKQSAYNQENALGSFKEHGPSSSESTVTMTIFISRLRES